MALEFTDLIIGYKDRSKSQQIAGPFDLKIPEKKLTAVIGNIARTRRGNPSKKSGA